MNLGLRILIVPGLVGVAYFAIAVWSDSADERRRYVQANLDAISPWAKFSQEPNFPALQSVVVRPADDTATLQAMCDRGGTVDLGGRMWVVHRITLSSRHNNLRLRNGTIYSPSDVGGPRRFGIIELCKGVTWQHIWYPDSPCNFTFENIEFVGSFTSYTDDVLTNHVAARDHAYVSAILAIDGSKIDSVTIRNCKARSMYGGFSLGYTVNAKVYDCEFDRIAGQAVSALTGDENYQRVIDLYRCRAESCGSFFDFSGYSRGVAAPKVPLAKVRQCTATNTLGRTKVHAQWDALIDRCTFRLTRPIPQRYYALSFPQAHTVNVSNTLIEGYPAGGIQCTDWTEQPFLDIRTTTIRGGQMGINSTATYHLANVRFENVLYNYGAPPASQYDTVTVNPASVDSVANKFRGLQAIVRDWNTLHGTTYDPDRFWWISNEVRNRMQQMEAN